jgi:glycosyltransferase involved in cell wall biosynthesis
MRIILFSEVFLPKVDGIVNTLCRLLEYFQRRGDNCLVVAPEGAVSAYAGAQVIGIPAVKVPFYPELKLANPLFNLTRQLDEFQPDLIHVANPFSIGWVGLRYAQTRQIPVAASYHTDIPGFAARWGLGAFSGGLQAYMRWMHNLADVTLCPSQATRAELASQGFERLHVWTRGVDTSKFSPQFANPAMRQRLTANQPASRLLVYVGRLSAEKRIDWLKPVLEAAPHTHLAIVGDGPQREKLEEHFRGLPVTFSGYLRGTDLAAAYASSDIFVFPAANETFGNVALEAMASGLPVVAPRSGGVLDFVEHGRNGLLFNQEDPNSLVEQTLNLIQHPGTAVQLGQAGLQTANQRDWDTVLSGLMTHYSDLIDHRSALPKTRRRPVPAQRMGLHEFP